MSAKQSCPTFCYPVDHSPPGSSLHGTLQARILEWVAMPSSSKRPFPPRDRTCISCISCIAGRLFTTHSFGCTRSQLRHVASSLWLAGSLVAAGELLAAAHGI